MNKIQLINLNDEARVDSRLVTARLNLTHKNTLSLIAKYKVKFERFGVLPFEMDKSHLAGRPEKYYLLNENQAYFLLSLSRNTDDVVDLKANLVMAFSDARNKAYKESLLNVFLLPKPATWEKRFDDSFYQALAKATNTIYAGHRFGTPSIYGQITLRWIYSVIMPKEVLEEVKARKNDSDKVHQWLQAGGLDLLDRQINAVKAIAISSVDRPDFEARCRQAFGKNCQLKMIYPQAS